MKGNGIFIIGAPRSGTSMMHKVFREHPGFVSVPREGDYIWMQYCHPEKNAWAGEGASRFDELAVHEIRGLFQKGAVSGRVWRAFDRTGLMKRPRLAAGLRSLYKRTPGGLKAFLGSAGGGGSCGVEGRLVEKSVHAGLWLDLVDKVFPDAFFIHLIRDPLSCIPSMMAGWRNPSRFSEFALPHTIRIQELGETREWCFALPAGWEQMDGTSLQEVCAFQWMMINHSILDYVTSRGIGDRYLSVDLDRFVTEPEGQLASLLKAIDVEEDGYFRALAEKLPRVNATPADQKVEKVLEKGEYTDRSLELFQVLRRCAAV